MLIEHSRKTRLRIFFVSGHSLSIHLKWKGNVALFYFYFYLEFLYDLHYLNDSQWPIKKLVYTFSSIFLSSSAFVYLWSQEE